MTTETNVKFLDLAESRIFLERYLESNDKLPFLEILRDDNDFIVFGNEFIEYVLQDWNGSGFLQLINVEAGKQEFLSFFVPVNYRDFCKILKLLTP